ncbi:MAG TPA: type II secretion system F family protein [Gemmatimonadaceae bacterium]|jgi:tight adherence protein C|nr:type II secretion system F family protein [Gemmatimonadaceae bacterium]
MLLVIAIATIGFAAYYFAEVATAPMRTRRNLVHRAANYGREKIAGKEMPKFRERVMLPLTTQVARVMLKVNPKASSNSVARKLMAAGMRNTSPNGFIASQGIFALLAAFLGLVVFGAAKPAAAPLFAALMGVLGFMGPGFVLGARVRARQAAVAAELPDALDLLSVSVEAGLGFDGAVQKLTEHMHGPLIEEFELALGEMRIGEGRQEALKKMAERSASPEMASFVRAIIQADQLGISLGRILRIQAGDTRLKRQLLAEEKAMKAPIKMLFPTVAFIFPAMFIVILGPAFLNLSKIFKF